jgi:RNA polymerase sigma factor (sigma-70 family)
MQCEALPETRVGTKTPECSRDSYAHNVDFSELLKLHWGQVFRICLRITRNEHDAEDASQDCFLRAFSHLHQFQGKAQISTWLSSIARNCSLMLLRKRRTRQEAQIENSPSSNGGLPFLDPPDSRPDQLSRISYAESSEQLVRSIAALPIRLRTVADLFILNELSIGEVAQILDLSNSSVKSRLFRARRRLSRFHKHCLKANSRSSQLNQQSRQASRSASPILLSNQKSSACELTNSEFKAQVG